MKNSKSTTGDDIQWGFKARPYLLVEHEISAKLKIDQNFSIYDVKEFLKYLINDIYEGKIYVTSMEINDSDLNVKTDLKSIYKGTLIDIIKELYYNNYDSNGFKLNTEIWCKRCELEIAPSVTYRVHYYAIPEALLARCQLEETLNGNK